MQMLKAVATTIALGTIALGMLIAPLPAGADDTSVATITVTGQGQISRAPDLATVAVTIVTNDDNAERALSENNRRYAALGSKLAANGVAASDITSTSISSFFSPRPSDRGVIAPGQLYGFVVTRNVQINVAALARSGAVIDAATAAGATQISGVTYGFRDRRAIERAAVAAAVADAYAQAQTIASAAHVTIVRVLRIANESGPGRFMPMAMGVARSAEPPVPTTISPTDLDVSASISITYVIR